MNAKLSSYAQNQLPGGKYWEPEPHIAKILKSLKPNNDVCESIPAKASDRTTGIYSRQLITGTMSAFEILNIALVALALFDQIADKQATESLL